MAQQAARVSLLKNISIEALIYPGQLLNAEQYARWCEYQYTLDPSITSTICKIKPTTVLQFQFQIQASTSTSPPIPPPILLRKGKDYFFKAANGWDGKDKIVTCRKGVIIFKLCCHTLKQCKNYLFGSTCSYGLLFKDHITVCYNSTQF